MISYLWLYSNQNIFLAMYLSWYSNKTFFLGIYNFAENCKLICTNFRFVRDWFNASYKMKYNFIPLINYKRDWVTVAFFHIVLWTWSKSTLIVLQHILFALFVQIARNFIWDKLAERFWPGIFHQIIIP